MKKKQIIDKISIVESKVCNKVCNRENLGKRDENSKKEIAIKID